MNQLEQYIHALSSPEDELLQELDRETNLRVVAPQMLSGHIQGRFLTMAVQMVKAKYVLEIGTFSGYSAICLAAGLDDDGVVHTCDPDDELMPFAQSFFDRSVHGSKIVAHIGSALDIAPELGRDISFDLVFIDGDKREYSDYYHMLMGDADSKPIVHSGSILIADNILWYGKVAAGHVEHGDRQTQALIDFNRLVHEDPRVENVILPLRDGLNIIRVK